MELRKDTIYTSYFNSPKVRELPDEVKISIARKTFGFTGETAEDLLVPEEIFKRYKSGDISLDDLKKAYKYRVLNYLNPQEQLKKYGGKVLLCHEVKGCHREEYLTFLHTNKIKGEEL